MVDHARAQLHLVDTQTGEIVEDERDALIDQLKRDLHGKQVQLGLLRRELRDLRMVEPEAVTIRDVLEYWKERCQPSATIAPGGKRWEKTRARLNEKLLDRDPLTPAELKLAVDGALLDPWHTKRGASHRLDAEFLFRSYENVERLRNRAIGFKAQTGVHLRDVLDVANELRVVSWPFLLRACTCTHKRIEHSRADPNLQGREGCFFCECEDFELDPFEWIDRRGGGT